MIVLFMALLNRARGDASWMPEWLPGRALWYVAPAVAMAAALQTRSWAVGAIWGVGYIIWAAPSWGHLIGLGRFEPERSPAPLDRLLLRWIPGHIATAFWLRNLLALPAFAGVAWITQTMWPVVLAIPFAALVVLAYEAAWRLRPSNPIWLAELTTGALWGLAIMHI